MTDKFDAEEAKENLLAREESEKDKQERERKILLKKVVSALKEEFKDTDVGVYLIGSILLPFHFSPRSDVDIVLKNYTQDRFDLWAKLERKIERKVEIILFETCSFQEFVLKEGFKVT